MSETDCGYVQTRGRCQRTSFWVTGLDAMIADLPESGAVVFVHSHAVSTKVRAVIHARRGADVGRATRVIVASRVEDEAAIALPPDVPVFHDPFVLAHRAHLDALTSLGGDIPVRIPAAGRA